MRTTTMAHRRTNMRIHMRTTMMATMRTATMGVTMDSVTVNMVFLMMLSDVK